MAAQIVLAAVIVFSFAAIVLIPLSSFRDVRPHADTAETGSGLPSPHKPDPNLSSHGERA